MAEWMPLLVVLSDGLKKWACNVCYLVCLWRCTVRAESLHAPWGAVGLGRCLVLWCGLGVTPVCCCGCAHKTRATEHAPTQHAHFTVIDKQDTRCGNKEPGLLLLHISGHVDDEEEGRALTRGLPSTVTQRFIHAHRLVWPWPLLEADRVSELRRNNAEC